MTNTNIDNTVSRVALDSKAILARLMATENLIVEHMPDAETAYFEPAARRLVLPVWKNMDNNVYDMLVGHEVGHALYTPVGDQPVADACARIDSNPDHKGRAMQYLNIVEDARIERLMKRKYPGLIHNFRRGYLHLYENNAFGLKGSMQHADTLPTIDRLNIKAKFGIHADVLVSLDTVEQMFFDEMMRTETFEQVVDLSKRIYDYARLPKAATPPPGAPTNPVPQDDGDDMTSDRGGGGIGEASDETPEPGEGSNTNVEPGDRQEGNEGEDQNEAGSVPTDTEQPTEEDAPESLTERAMTRIVDRLRDKSGKQYSYIDLPGKTFPWRRLVNDYKAILRDFASLKINETGYAQFRSDSKNYVNMLVKEFELRKAADINARAAIGNTGTLDPDRLHQHKYVEDIFRKVTTVREGKNHGMVMFIDWSGSMDGVLESTVKQVMVLAWFCKQVNIPFEVYSFGDQGKHHGIEPESDSTLVVGNLILHNWLSSRMSGSEFTRAMQVFLTMAGPIRYSQAQQYHTGGTPLDYAIVAARYIVDDFRRDRNIQVVNTVILTDGDSTCGFESKTDRLHSTDVVVVRDPQTRSQIGVEGYRSRARTANLLRLLKATTGTNLVGFYLLNGGKRALADVCGMNRHGSADFDALVAKMRTDKYVEINKIGYDAFFVVPGNDLEQRLAEKDMLVNKTGLTKGKIAGAFLKEAARKATNRVLLRRFIGWITK